MGKKNVNCFPRLDKYGAPTIMEITGQAVLGDKREDIEELMDEIQAGKATESNRDDALLLLGAGTGVRRGPDISAAQDARGDRGLMVAHMEHGEAAYILDSEEPSAYRRTTMPLHLPQIQNGRKSQKNSGLWDSD